tara:strand:- start:841 stop:1578 length:738 start_codon:yes stop_codon:yes gene_type:complete
MANCVIKKENLSRIIKDVADIIKDPLDDNNIFYIHDENSLLNGYALIIGPENTPYANGFYFFHFLFPPDYPYTPPVVKYLTNDGTTRFHPNFYRNGKCCLSILNTWKGEEWTSCLTIKTILLSLCMVFTDNPLLNEPGVKECSKDIPVYNDIISFKNIDISIIEVINKTPYHFFAHLLDVTVKKDIFLDIVNEWFEKKKKDIMKDLEKRPTRVLNASISYYDMGSFRIDNSSLLKKFKKIKKAKK